MSASATLPLVIQGGMGIAVSNWVLANAVSARGQLGVVSGTAVDSVLVRRLQDGDIGGHVRRAMENFPWPHVSADVLKRYFLPDGRADGQPYKLLPMYRKVTTKAKQELTMLANFVEVWLAKEGHDSPVGINLLTKVQMPNLDSLYGAMLAGVDYVLMGAGIPKEIPGVLDRLADHEPARLRLDVDEDANGPAEYMTLDPRDFWDGAPLELKRPDFLPIVSASSLALMLTRKATGKVNGFIVEGPTAGGHNAPPRGSVNYNDRGEPVYGERDLANFEQMRDIGLPFWIAGGAGSPEGLRQALDVGAAGIQVGTLFAYTDESGLDPRHKRAVLRQVARGEIDVLTDGRASPTGFPFKVVQLEGTNAKRKEYLARERVCDLGYLRTAYRRENGRLDYRCPAEPVDTYVKKGGDEAETTGRKCLCNALMADIGMGQVTSDGGVERAILTSGDDLKYINRFVGQRESYGAAEVLDYLLEGAAVTATDGAALSTTVGFRRT
jgi:nitronate monooxygenase